jgi:hypothetical protein
MSQHPRTAKCAVPGCDVVVPPQMLMCGPHWALVPVKLQRVVNRTWQTLLRTPDEAVMREYKTARREALAAVVKAQEAAQEAGDVDG